MVVINHPDVKLRTNEGEEEREEGRRKKEDGNGWVTYMHTHTVN